MTLRPVVGPLALVLTSIMFAGCGEQADIPGTNATPIAPHSPSRLGFTPAGFGDSVAGHYRGTIGYGALAPYDRDLTLTASGSAEALLTVDCDNAPARDVESGDKVALVLECATHIWTADGALDEEALAFVFTTLDQSGHARLGSAGVEFWLDPAKLKGTLRASVGSDFTIGPFEWSFTIDSNRASGQLWFNGMSKRTNGDGSYWTTAALMSATRDPS